MIHLATRWAPRLSTVLALLVAGAVLAMWGFGFRATREWKRSSLQLVETRAEELAELLVTGLTRDMRGVQATVLANRDWTALPGTSASDTLDLVAAAFARYPYPESFFQWRPGTDDVIVLFNRADRPPSWIPEEKTGYQYPVVVARNPPRFDPLAKRIARDIKAGHRYSTFETALGGEPYQIVARIQYGDGARGGTEVFGYTVNLAWATKSYFPQITRQVARISDLESDVDLAVLDDRGGVVTGRSVTPPATVRPFLLLYFDPQTVLLDPPLDLPLRTWTVAVSTARHPALVWATQNADWTLLVAALAGVVLGFSLVLTVHTVRESARLAEMRSDFVSTVTHELKTPIATIRAVGDTLVRGRMTTPPNVVMEYAQVLVQETKRLTRLVDNLLAYARVTDVTEVYSFEAHAVSELVDDVLRGFRYQLAEFEFEVHCDVPSDLPLIRCDRTALRLALDNVVDNAIRYGGARRWLSIRAFSQDANVVIDVEDRGDGIPADELPNIHRKFVRGRLAVPGGSGLGLAIVSRIVADHGGRLTIRSTPGAGTTASLSLPAFERD